MPDHVSLQQINHYLWNRQGFGVSARHAAEASPIGRLSHVFGHYATAPMCYLGPLARDPSFTFEDLDRALYEERAVVRVRAMRYSAFLIPRALLPAVYQATKSQLMADHDKKITKHAGLTHDEYHALTRDIEALLASEADAPKAMLTSAIKQALKPQWGEKLGGLNIVIGRMAAQGRVIRAQVRGGYKSAQYHYARLADWLPGVDLASVTVEAAQAELARLYFDSYGPATLDDFRWWSGLTAADARAALDALADRAGNVLVPLAWSVDHHPDDQPFEGWITAARLPELQATPDDDPSGAALLPAWDAYSMAYTHRARYLAPQHAPYAYDKAGNGARILLWRGAMRGVWDYAEDDKHLRLKVALFAAPADSGLTDLWNALDPLLRRLMNATGAASGELIHCADGAPDLITGARNLHLSPLKDRTGEVVLIV